ncbi:MBL fold metallo-hydrolase [Herbaspirillum rubrisubalbicans]|uniref:MBL fold metallo-hydrolase n=1 Tax=Herbaspirillum rubrisubalbicans TaxID=80842 RepID=UPI003CC549E2
MDHGACALLTIPGADGVAHRILIDCGHLSDSNEGPWYPGTHLRNIGVSKVDLLVCTNYDEDHASGAVNLVEEGIKVDCSCPRNSGHSDIVKLVMLQPV